MALIGVIADTHCEAPDAADFPDAVLREFQGCELIVHCGDLMTGAVVDRLARTARVLAVRSPADRPTGDERIVEPPTVLEVDGARIGVLSRPADLAGHDDLADGPNTDIGSLHDRLDDIFGAPVDVVLYRGSHRAQVHERGGTLYVDPGSPTFWAGRRATVGRLSISDGRVRYEVVDVTRRLGWRVRLTHDAAVGRQAVLDAVYRLGGRS
jgi:putative phosphoesterase